MKKAIFLVPFFWLLTTCMNNVVTYTGGENCGGTSDETVVRTGAVIYEQDGMTPAAGAMVKIFRCDAIDGQYILMQKTGSDGRYSVGNLGSGVFNVLVEKDSMVAFQDSVYISSTGTTLSNDTLDCASTLSGFATLQPLVDPRSVIVQVVGTDRYSNDVDSCGHFHLKGLAGGTYTLSFKSAIPDYTPAVRKVTVHNCANDTLEDTIRVIDNNITSWITEMRALSEACVSSFSCSISLAGVQPQSPGGPLFLLQVPGGMMSNGKALTNTTPPDSP